MGRLAVLLLAQRAISEGPRWTRAVGGLSPAILGNVHEQAWKDHLRLLAAALLTGFLSSQRECFSLVCCVAQL